MDAADLHSSEDEVDGTLDGEELDVGLAGEIELWVGPEDQVGEPEREELKVEEIWKCFYFYLCVIWLMKIEANEFVFEIV